MSLYYCNLSLWEQRYIYMCRHWGIVENNKSLANLTHL